MTTYIKVRSWRRIALPISLVANVLFVAIIGGYWFKIEASREVVNQPLASALLGAERSLSAPDAAAFKAVMNRDAPRYVPAAERLASARMELDRQLTAMPYDKEAAQQALAAWQTDWAQFMGDVSGPLLDAFGQISPEGRKRLIAYRKAQLRAASP